MTLTKRQDDVLTAIKALTQQWGRPPTRREIGDRVELASTSSVTHQLRMLAKRQLIELAPAGTARGVRVSHGVESTCPHCGRGYVPAEAS